MLPYVCCRKGPRQSPTFSTESESIFTISLDYFGDSVFNSIGDICAMMTGYFVASNVPVRITIAGGLLLDLFLLFWYRDSLAINILMLIYPTEGIKNWQMFR